MTAEINKQETLFPSKDGKKMSLSINIEILVAKKRFDEFFLLTVQVTIQKLFQYCLDTIQTFLNHQFHHIYHKFQQSLEYLKIEYNM